MKKGIIYMATINGKHYIGKTINSLNQRKKEHLYDAFVKNADYAFHKAIRKHGEYSIYWRILESDIPKKSLPTHEKFWIKFYNTYESKDYNMTEGGDSNPMTNPLSRAKASLTHSAKAAKGEHPCQRSDVRKKNSATWKEKAIKGEHPMQNKEIAARSVTNKQKNRIHPDQLTLF